MGYSAISDLFVPLIYALLGLYALVFLFLTFKIGRSSKPWTLFAFIASIFLIFSFRSCIITDYHNMQLEQVGVYYLTSYPNCDNCTLELKEDMTYEVRSDGQVIEKSNWHFESGGDYWITYLDDDKYQLGAGNYAYTNYKLKYPTTSHP